MTALHRDDGRPFATGASRIVAAPAGPPDRLPRLRLNIMVAGVDASAVLDTGGAYLIIDPAFASAVGVPAPLHTDRIMIRGQAFTGGIHRFPVTIPAESGESLTFEATAFVPELTDGEDWTLPSYMGWGGCLDRIRLAIDPDEERVYFGALG